MGAPGQHDEELIRTNTCLYTRDFDEVVSGTLRSLASPGELAAERRRVAFEVVGEVDRHAAERVVDAIVALAS